MKRTATTIAALSALTLAGCTAGPDQTTSPSSSTTPESTPVVEVSEPAEPRDIEATPDTDVDTDGPRAAKSLKHLMTTLNNVYEWNVDSGSFTDECEAPIETLEDYRVCAPDDPLAYLDSMESPGEGELVVTLMPESWGGGEYDPDRVFTVPYLAEILHGYIGRHADGPLQVTTITPDGEYQATHGRIPERDNEDAPQTEAELEAWADARFEDWLRSMNFTYQGLCGGVDSVADYRQCVPDDPHGYITSMEAPAAGELIVHVENGAWQGGQYEPAPQFMAGNVALKIGRYSNEVELLTVITEDGQSHTVGYDPNAGTYTEPTREPML